MYWKKMPFGEQRGEGKVVLLSALFESSIISQSFPRKKITQNNNMVTPKFLTNTPIPIYLCAFFFFPKKKGLQGILILPQREIIYMTIYACASMERARGVASSAR